jgi:hypothetical protein
MRLVPARSAPVYVHHVHTKAIIFGSNPVPEAGVFDDIHISM